MKYIYYGFAFTWGVILIVAFLTGDRERLLYAYIAALSNTILAKLNDMEEKK